MMLECIKERGWREVQLKDISKIIGGGTPSRKTPEYWHGDIPWLTTSDLSDYPYKFVSRGQENITREGLENSSAKLLPKNTIVYSSRASIGYIAITANSIATSQGFRNFVPDKRKVNIDFLYYALKYYTPLIEKIASGATYKEISGSELKRIKIFLPPLNEQIIISTIISNFDSYQENNLNRINTLEEILTDLFNGWFTHLLYPGHVKDEIVKTEYGLKPKSWKTYRASDAIEIDPNYKVPDKKEYKYVPMASISTSSMIIKEYELRDSKSGSKFKNKDTLFARITPSLENGKTAYVQFLKENEIGIGSTEFIVLKSRTLSPEFVYLLSRTERFRENAIKSMIGASGRQRVQKECFDNFLFPHPPKNILRQFTKLVNPIFQEVYKLNEQRNVLLEIRDLLIPKLISGEIDVTNLDIEV
jgi:type I restriction enzyme S subunit